MKNGIWLLVCYLIVLHQPVLAEVYKWTDENGQVHYSDRPKDGANSISLEAPAGDSSGVDDKQQSQSRERQRRLLESFEADRQEEKQQAAEIRQQQQERDRHCQKARADLRYYERSRALYTKDDKGERNFLSDAQREEIIRQQRELVAEWCD